MVKDPGKTRDGKMRFVSYKQPGMQSIAISRLLFIIVFFISISPLYGSDQEIFDADSWSKSYQKCIAGNCLNGKGTMVLYSIQKYIGEFKEGRRHGQGTMRYPDGRVYKGEFKSGKRTGTGTMTYPDDRNISGQFLDGNYVGSVQK
jgi:hypothetical protein